MASAGQISGFGSAASFLLIDRALREPTVS